MKLFDVKLGKCIVGFYYKTLWTDNTLKQSNYRHVGVYTSRHLSYVWNKDEKTKETYYTFVKDGGFYSRSRGHIGKSRYYYGSSMGINLYCNIIWIVDENGIPTSKEN